MPTSDSRAEIDDFAVQVSNYKVNPEVRAFILNFLTRLESLSTNGSSPSSMELQFNSEMGGEWNLYGEIRVSRARPEKQEL